MNFQMFTPTRLLFGKGSLNSLHDCILKNTNFSGKKALLVISNGKSAKENGNLDKTKQELQKAGIQWVLFDKIEASPMKSTVMEGGKLAKEQQCELIVALGGGSVLDASKCIAVVGANEGDLWDYISVGSGKGMELKEKPLPVIAITTTAGTGSEVDPWGAVTNEDTNEKIGYGTDEMYPIIAVVDPELMLTVPPLFTAYQGFDAMFHSIEGYISKGANFMSDMYAETAIKNISENLVNTIINGKNIEAREAVAFGNTLSGYVMKLSGGTCQHSLENAMSAFYPALPHGAGLLMICKAYFRNRIENHICDSRFLKMAEIIGQPLGIKAERPEDFLQILDELMEKCGVTNLRMSDYGIKKSDFVDFIKNAHETMGDLFFNERKEISDEECIQIYEQSFL